MRNKKNARQTHLYRTAFWKPLLQPLSGQGPWWKWPDSSPAKHPSLQALPRQVWSITHFSFHFSKVTPLEKFKPSTKEVINEQTWSNILPPFSFFHFHTLRRNSSLPMENLSKDGSRDFSCFSTTTWVAIPAWSHPGTQRVRKPRILRQRTNVSWVNKKNIVATHW